jgi:hypothetical protein
VYYPNGSPLLVAINPEVCMRTSYSAWQDIRHHYDDADIAQERKDWEKAHTCAKCGAAALPVYVGSYDQELAEPVPFEAVAVVDGVGYMADDGCTPLCPTCLVAFRAMFKAWLDPAPPSPFCAGVKVRRRNQVAAVKSVYGVVAFALAGGKVHVRWDNGHVSRKYPEELEVVAESTE